MTEEEILEDEAETAEEEPIVDEPEQTEEVDEVQIEGEEKPKKEKKQRKPKIEVKNSLNAKKLFEEECTMPIERRARKLFALKVRNYALAKVTELVTLSQGKDHDKITDEDVEELFS